MLGQSRAFNGSFAAHKVLDKFILPFCFIKLEKSAKDLVARTILRIPVTRDDQFSLNCSVHA